MAARRKKKRDPNEAAAVESLGVMMDSIKRDATTFFGMGEFRAKKKLPNGYVVRVVIYQPKNPVVRPAGLKPAQVQAWEDIQSGKVEHNKYTCPGCPIH